MNTYDLIDYRNNSFSQNGEDGIIAKIIEALELRQGWFVEFGAWDGVHFSNTKSLADRGWNGVFIEGDPDKYKDLRKNYDNNDKIFTVCAMVSNSGNNTLDHLLKKLPIPCNFDVLSIDIDGADYHVWESLNAYKPKIVLIESNQTFPYNVEFVQKENEHIGSSALSLYRLGRRKGYKFVCYNVNNCVFVRNDLCEKLNLVNSSFAYLYNIGGQQGTGGYFASDYDGFWYWLHERQLAWDIRNVQYPNRLLRKGRYLKYILFSLKDIFRQIKRAKSQENFFNGTFTARGDIFRVIEDKNELSSLFES
ncbi:MAG: hypothetical protein A2Z25_19445 [Planctomycetes bacterium RBG_16_55_9]|nr:MAG: hypothetical protein A2Z25_19445 [Planctomycetes bacterium RBG_16_55_9]